MSVCLQVQSISILVPFQGSFALVQVLLFGVPVDLSVAVHLQCILTDPYAGVLHVPPVGGSPGAGGSRLERLLAAQDVLADDFPEGVAELPDAVGIN